MKKQRIMAVSLLTVFTMGIFAGCSKSKKDSSGTGYRMTATTGGTAFNSDTCTISVYPSTDSSYEIDGGNISSFPNIDLILHHYHGVGTYSFTSSGSNPYFTGDYNASNGFYGPTDGSVVVTAVTATSVSGTFSFDASGVNTTGTLSISNGTFTAQVQ